MKTPHSQPMQNIQKVQSELSISQSRRPRRLNSRTALTLLAMLAPLAWAGLLLYTRFVPPQGILAFAAFFILLYVALASIFVPLAYIIGLRFISSRLYRATMRHALRQGALLSLLIVFNLLLRALNSWSIFTAVVSLAIIGVIEMLALARK